MHAWAAGKLALVLDLGSCVVESDTALANSLPADEAALYECIKLKIKDVSAYVVDGEFSFSAIEEAAQADSDQVCCWQCSLLMIMKDLACCPVSDGTRNGPQDPCITCCRDP